MKTQFLMVTAGVLGLVAGCSTPITTQSAVGPDPSVAKVMSTDGNLRVFSATETENTVGNEFPYKQRTDYYIYDSTGKEIQSINDNNKGQFEDVPKAIALAPGSYKIKALTAVGFGEWISVPVVIEPGRTTEVHLNGHWQPPVGTPKSELALSPSGFPMGWNADQTQGN